MAENAEPRPPFPADYESSRRRVTLALVAYRYNDFARLHQMLTWCDPRVPRNWSSWAPLFLPAVLLVIIGSVLDHARVTDATELAAALFLLVGIPFSYAFLVGFPLAWLLTSALSPQVRASLERRVRECLVTFFDLYGKSIPTGDGNRGSLTALGDDLGPVNRPRPSLSAWSKAWVLLIGTSAVFVRSWVGDGSDAESLTAFVEASSSSWSIPALLIGLSLIVTSRLAEQANRDLYEAELQPPLKELSAEFGNVADLARYPGSLVTDVVGVAGVALVTAAVVALAANLT